MASTASVMETSFDTFWNTFDNKKSKDKAERKWNLMSAKDQTDCMDSLPSYIKSTPDRQFRKHPVTYLNQKCWNDKLYHNEGEGNLVVAWAKPKPLSTYKPEVFERSEFISTLRRKIKGYYDSGKPITDFGGAVTTFLVKQCQMTIPKDIKQDIERDCIQEKERERNRFEDVYSGTIEGDTRDLCLKWWLNDQKEKNINVIELI